MHNNGMLEYVREHYRYEDMPEYGDRPVVQELAKQRLQTMDAIAQWEQTRQ